MTREEAIALLNEQYETCKRIYDCSADQRKSYPNVPQFMEALGMALSALRPVSREQVEKAWRGCEKCNGAGEYSRYAENLTKILLAKYCPHCGRPLTDKAMQMVMERLEALQKELCKHARGKENRAQIAEEIADVQIMLEQMELLHDCEGLVAGFKAQKLDRLEKRLREG
jgi:hypothetical protein|nr:MAG TPA: nucleoside triphosphate pyrophosphohydrolase [Caudoviricetes sp.]